MMLKPLETERLVLRPLEKSDGERMFLLDSAPEVMRYIGMPVLTERSQSDEVIRMIQQQYKENGIGRFAVVEKKSNLLIGWSGLKLNREEVNHHPVSYTHLDVYKRQTFRSDAPFDPLPRPRAGVPQE